MPSWFVRYPPRVGVVSSTVRKALSSMTGQHPQYGPMQLALKPFSVAMGGHVPTAGPIQAEIKRLQASFTKQYTTGTSVLSLKKTLAAMGGIVPNNATIQATTKPNAFAGNGFKSYESQLAAAIKKVDSMAMVGFQLQSGTMPATLKKVGMSSGGTHFTNLGPMAPVLRKATIAIVGTAPDPFTPVTQIYETPGTYEFVAPPGSGYKLDRVAIGGGRAGRQYGFGVSANGGRSGKFGYDTLTEGVDFFAGQTITVVVGSGGASNGALGTPSSITVNGSTIEGIIATETGYLSGYTGEPVNSGNTNSNKDLLLNGETYVGGSGGTGTSSNDPAGSPVYPGGGGWGSNSNGINGRPGGNGKVWLRFYV